MQLVCPKCGYLLTQKYPNCPSCGIALKYPEETQEYGQCTHQSDFAQNQAHKSMANNQLPGFSDPNPQLFQGWHYQQQIINYQNQLKQQHLQIEELQAEINRLNSELMSQNSQNEVVNKDELDDDLNEYEMFETRSFRYALSLLMFWIKGSITVTNREIRCKTANTVLGLIPAGVREQTIPLRNISDASMDTRYKVIPLVIGVIFALGMVGAIPTGLAQGENPIATIIASIFGLLIAVMIFGSGIKTSLTIQRAGSDFKIEVPFFEKGKMADAQDAIREALNYEADKTDMYIHAERIGSSFARGLNGRV